MPAVKVIPPSLLNVYGPVPPETEVTIEPSFAPQLGSFVVELTVKVIPDIVRVAEVVPWHPRPSADTILYVPAAKPVKVSPD